MGEQGNGTTQEFRREDVWPQMPRCAGGPVWGGLIEDALTAYREQVVGYGLDADDYGHEWADGWVPVYNKDRADKFHALDLWACDEVADMMDELEARGIDEGGTFSFCHAYGQALYCAARLTWDAVVATVVKRDAA